MDEFAPFLKINESFIVRNTSPQVKTITIFGMSIPYGHTCDLLQIPGVAEDDLRASLLKGELQHKIRANDITVIFSDIDLLQFNDAQKAFLQGAGIINGLTPAVALPNASWMQSTWYIDPRNKSGLASNHNDGLTAITPISNWSEVIRRYGTNSPTLPQDTTWNFLSGSPLDGSDPVVFSPIMIKSSKAFIAGAFGSAQKLGHGILSGVVPRVYGSAGSGTLLKAVLSSAGAVGPDMFIRNTTAGKVSHAWTNLALGGGLFSLSQPLTPCDSSTNTESYVDTWANGDTFEVYNFEAVQIVRFEPIVSEYTAVPFTNKSELRNLTLADIAGNTLGASYIADAVTLQECRVDRRYISTRSAHGRNQSFQNCDFTNGFGFSGGPLSGGAGLAVDNVQGPRIVSGMMGGNFQCVLLDGDVIVRVYGLGGPTIVASGSFIGTVYNEGGLYISGDTAAGAFLFDGPRIWGPGTLDVAGAGGVLGILGTAVDTLLCGQILIAGNLTAFSATTANPSVINGHVSVTPANIDANFPPVGVGLYNPVGAAITSYFLL